MSSSPGLPSSASFTITGAVIMHTPDAAASGELRVTDAAITADPAPAGSATFAAPGAYVVPLLVESAVAARPESERDVYDLVPGNAATFAVIQRRVTAGQVRNMLVVNPRDLVAVYVDGHREVAHGRPTRPAGQDLTDPDVHADWVGTWEDPQRDLLQYLNANGRYSETRGGRPDAYTGQFWVRAGRITYLDDSGFWAFGELLDGTIHHAGLVMTRR